MKKFLSINTIAEDVMDFGGYKDLDRNIVKKLANSALRLLEVPSDYIDKIVLLDLEDYKVNLPADIEKIVQVAYKGGKDFKVKRTEIVEWVEKLYNGSGCELIISKECPKCHKEQTKCSCNNSEIIYDVDANWEANHIEFKYNHMKHYYRHGGLDSTNIVHSPYHPEFTLIKATTHSFFNADSHIKGCLNLNNKLMANCNIEYKIDYPIMEVNRKDGKILMSYLAARVDKEGYRMIPDLEEVFDALKWSIIEALEFREINKSLDPNTRNHHKQMWSAAKNEKTQAMGRVLELVNTPNYEDWISFLDNNYFKMIKDQGVAEQLGVRTPNLYNHTLNRLTKHE